MQASLPEQLQHLRRWFPRPADAQMWQLEISHIQYRDNPNLLKLLAIKSCRRRTLTSTRPQCASTGLMGLSAPSETDATTPTDPASSSLCPSRRKKPHQRVAQYQQKLSGISYWTKAKLKTWKRHPRHLGSPSNLNLKQERCTQPGPRRPQSRRSQIRS